MHTIHPTDAAIAMAYATRTLRMTERYSRFGTTYVVIEDAGGIIDVAADRGEAERRIRWAVGLY